MSCTGAFRDSRRGFNCASNTTSGCVSSCHESGNNSDISTNSNSTIRRERSAGSPAEGLLVYSPAGGCRRIVAPAAAADAPTDVDKPPFDGVNRGISTDSGADNVNPIGGGGGGGNMISQTGAPTRGLWQIEGRRPNERAAAQRADRHPNERADAQRAGQRPTSGPTPNKRTDTLTSGPTPNERANAQRAGQRPTSGPTPNERADAQQAGRRPTSGPTPNKRADAQRAGRRPPSGPTPNDERATLSRPCQ
eukprot:Em0017g634a